MGHCLLWNKHSSGFYGQNNAKCQFNCCLLPIAATIVLHCIIHEHTTMQECPLCLKYTLKYGKVQQIA